MSHQYRVRNNEQIHFITFTIVDWVDVFIRPVYKKIIVDSLLYCQVSKGVNLHAWCLMTNHLHLLVSIREPFYLPDFVRDFKKYTNKKIINAIECENESRKDWMLYRFKFHAKFNPRIKDYKVWIDGYHAIECSDNVILSQKLDYVHESPVKSEVVSLPEEYLYSSARNYMDQKGLLEVILLDDGFSNLVKSITM
jgi:REP element-mobilizing transposase RayT